MATRGIEVHALQKKTRIIAETLCELGKIPAPSIPDFARFAQIDYDTLKTAWRSGRLSIELQEKMATAAGFHTSDHTWLDTDVDPMLRSSPDGPAYPGRDTAAAFRAMLRRQLELPGTGTLIRIKNSRPQLVDSNLASFSVADSGQGAALGEPNPLFLCLVLEPGFHPRGIAYGFQRVRVRLVFDAGSQARIKHRLGHATTVKINGAFLEVRGGEHHPEWFLHVPDVVLKGEYVTTENPLCLLADTYIGEEFRAEVAVRPMDGTVVAVDGKPLLEAHKRHVLELLCAKRLPGTSDSQGWVSLGVQRLRIVRADNL
jgi:hypothetical protein